MIIRAFTGPTFLNEDQADLVEMTILGLEQPDVVRTGLAKGVDTMACHTNYFQWQDARHVLYVPAAKHNDKLRLYIEENPLRRDVEVIKCPERESAASAYRRRNEMMVHQATELVAFVYKDEFYRSGEWMTINIARKEGTPVTMFKIGDRRWL
jgi:hypothetical protein